MCVCVPSPQPDNRAGPMPDWGQLVAAGGERWRRRKRGVGEEGIRPHCLTWMSELEAEGPNIRQLSESVHRARSRRETWATKGLFLTPTHILYHLTLGWKVKLG